MTKELAVKIVTAFLSRLGLTAAEAFALTEAMKVLSADGEDEKKAK